MAYDAAAIGLTIKNLRVSAEMSQEDLATAIGMTQSTITRIERGDQGLILSNLSAIADFFGVKLGAMIDGDVESASGPQVQITRSVACRTCGVIASGVGTEEARKVRAGHIGEHVRGER